MAVKKKHVKQLRQRLMDTRIWLNDILQSHGNDFEPNFEDVFEDAYRGLTKLIEETGEVLE
jgi:NTP pyrophosphatase (non-canonical NTP hydrolase)